MRTLIFLRGSDTNHNKCFAQSLSLAYGRENTEIISVDRLIRLSLRSVQDQRANMIRAAESCSIRAAQAVAQRKPLIILSSPIVYPANCIDAIAEVCSGNDYCIRQMIVPHIHGLEPKSHGTMDFTSHVLGRGQKIFDRYRIPYISESALDVEIAFFISAGLTPPATRGSITQVPS